jgi:uncharacterized protein YbjT (DUF2867 family)
MSVPLIVVTGATGKTGKLLINALAGRSDVKVRAAVRSVTRARALFPGVEIVAMDYAHPETVEAAFAGANRLYLVTPGGTEQVEQTWVAVEAARKAGFDRIVRLGSLPYRRGPSIQVERWCTITEDIVAGSGIAYTFLRPSWFNQNFTEYIFAPQVKMGLILAPLGNGKAGWIDCRDIAAVAVETLVQEGHEGKAYTLTGPELLGMRDLVATLSRAAGRTIRYLDIPAGIQRLFIRMAGFPPRDVEAMLELLKKLKDDHLTDVTDDVERVTGRPAIRFEQFAADHHGKLR